jgi:hypothetical protein
MAFKTVKITPTLSTDAYADGDVLFVNTEFSLPHRSCKLIGGLVIDYEKDLVADAVVLYFMQRNKADLGTINETANISNANLKLNQLIGACQIGTGDPVGEIDSAVFKPLSTYGDVDGSEEGGMQPIVLTSVGPDEEYQSDPKSSTPMYVSGVIQSVSTAPNFSATDAIDIILYFEY